VVGVFVGEVMVDEVLLGIEGVILKFVVASLFAVPIFDVFFVTDDAVGDLCLAHKFYNLIASG